MSYRTPLLFPRYGDDAVGSNGCIMAGSFTSASDIGGGVIIGNDTSVATFNSNGWFPNSLSGIQFTVAELPGIADLYKGYTFSFEIEKGIFDATYAPSTIEYFLRLNPAGTARAWYKHTTLGRITASQGAGNVNTDLLNGRYTGTHAKVWITGGHGWWRMYTEGLIINEGSSDLLAISDFTISGKGNAGIPSMAKHAFRNVALYNRAMPRNAEAFTVAFFGDSIANQGTYPRDNFAILVETPDGQTENGIFNGSTSRKDNGMTPVIHSELIKHGVGINGNRILHWAEGGSGVVVRSTSILAGNLGDRIDVAINGKYPIPDVAIIFIGTNDLSSGTAVTTAALLDGTYTLAYQTQVNKLIAAGTKLIIPCTICRHPDEPDPDNTLERRTAMNNSIRALTGVKVAETFKAIGGENVSTDMFQSGLLHPNSLAHPILGRTIESVILNNIYA